MADVASTPLSITDSDELISSHDATHLSPVKLVNHLTVYGPRDRTFTGLRCPGTHYRTTQGFIINFSRHQKVEQSLSDAYSPHNVFHLCFENVNDHYDCRWNPKTQHIEVKLVDEDDEDVIIDLDAVLDG